MRVLPYTNVRANFAALMDKVCNNSDRVVITRGADKDPAVLISLKDLESLEETLYLFSTPNNAIALSESILECEELIAKKEKRFESGVHKKRKKAS